MNISIQLLIQQLQQQCTRQVLVLTDANVDRLYPHYLDVLTPYVQVDKVVIPAGEASKNMEQTIRIWHHMLENGYDKNLCIINFGGGMVCDLGGFVAATYKRGVHCINYPTTLLAMIDAAIGGKTAVDMDGVKNCIGIVRQPNFVVPADVQLLRTLSDDELLSGFGELIKYALISSKTLFQQLEKVETLSADTIKEAWITQCVDFKNRIVAIDPEDKKERHVLNFGHTFGHAVESYRLALGEPIPHGVAVAQGMLYECQLAEKEGLLSSASLQRIQLMLSHFFAIPTLTPELMEALIPYLLQDKKNADGRVHFNFLREIGCINYNITDTLTLEEIKR